MNLTVITRCSPARRIFHRLARPAELFTGKYESILINIWRELKNDGKGSQQYLEIYINI